MPANIAQRRAAKAQRRKSVVAAKRLADLRENSLAGQVRRAAKAPLRHCLLQDLLSSNGIATMIVAREAVPGEFAVGTFLIDGFCLGVKDAVFRRVEAEELDELMAAFDAAGSVRPCDPSYARKLLRDVVAYAGRLGFAPHKDFLAVESLFGDVDVASCNAEFTFGDEGKPHYIVGPFDTPAQIQRRIAQLEASVGADGFHYTTLLDDEESWDWEDSPIIDGDTSPLLELPAPPAGE